MMNDGSTEKKKKNNIGVGVIVCLELCSGARVISSELEEYLVAIRESKNHLRKAYNIYQEKHLCDELLYLVNSFWHLEGMNFMNSEGFKKANSGFWTCHEEHSLQAWKEIIETEQRNQEVDFQVQENTICKFPSGQKQEGTSSFSANFTPSWLISMLLDFGINCKDEWKDKKLVSRCLRPLVAAQPMVNYRSGVLSLMDTFERLYSGVSPQANTQSSTPTMFMAYCKEYDDNSHDDDNVGSKKMKKKAGEEVLRRIVDGLNYSVSPLDSKNDIFKDTYCHAAGLKVRSILDLFWFLVSIACFAKAFTIDPV